MKILALLILACGLVAAQYQPPVGSGGGPPTGSAGGALAGTYPNPTIAGLGTNAGYAVCTDGSGNLIFCSGSSAPALLGAATNTFTGIQQTSSYFLSSQTGLGTTTATGSYLQNATLSTSGATVQVSPASEQEGHVWNTTATAADNFFREREYTIGVSGTTPTWVHHWQGSIDTGTASFSDAMTLTSTGNLAVVGSIMTGSVIMSANQYAVWSGRTTISSPGVGQFELSNSSLTSFSYIDLGPDTNMSFPRLSVTTQANPILSLLDANGGATAQLAIPYIKAASTSQPVCITSAGILELGSVIAGAVTCP